MRLKFKKLFTQEFKHSLREKLKLVIMNKDTYEEKFSLELSPLKVFVIVTISMLVLVILTTLLITITPLRENIPGYGSTKQGQKIAALQMRIDSLQKGIAVYDTYRKNIQNIFITEDFSDDTSEFEIKEVVKNKELTFAYTKEDSMLMDMKLGVSHTNNELTVSKNKERAYSLLYVPFRGKVVSKYNAIGNHYGIISRCEMEHKLYAIASGNVLFVTKTIHSDRVVGIQHPDNMVSLYTFKGVALVEQGSIVNAGQFIGTVSVEVPEIYFELWINGKPVNPEKYISF